MILYTTNDLKIYETRSDKPNEDWTGKAEFVIDETSSDNAELIEKIKEFAPYFDYVKNDAGELVDVTKTKDFVPEIPVSPVETLRNENKELQAKVKALTESNQMLEDCLVEMAEIVYA